QDYNNLRNASVARYEAGIAHYYIDRNTVWRAIDTYSVAWHVADANGNNSYIGYEVNESMNASNKDFMANEQAVFKKAAADMLYYGLPVNRDTVMLHNQFVPTACPHRSMAIHTGFDPVRQGAASSNIKNQLKDYFIKEIKKYYNDPSLKAGSPASSDVPDKSTVPSTKPEEEAQTNVGSTGWKKNQHGTWYKPESATFTCGNTAIATRVGSPKLNDDIFGYWFQPSGYTPYDEVCLQDGHVWIGFDWNNTRYYMPIRTWNKVAPPNHGVGQLWGYIS
ncbi:MAG: SH3 domain-containing protein, partial [Staphylococcus equorum]|nr:SH3 domain-containing protein [Staphylococcus equorum]